MITDLHPAEYAALWGCDPCYDTFPRQRGDGHLFYNYNSENDPEFYKKFIPAIERTIQCVQQRPECYKPEDEQELTEFLDHVKQEYHNLISV